MPDPTTTKDELIRRLNAALGWELRALTLYAHYAAYVEGIHRLHLQPFFDGEATESLGHANSLRTEIVKLGGVAVTERDETKIVHTTDYQLMLRESLKTESHAAKSYKEFMDLPGVDPELFDVIEQVYFAEERSVEELTRLIPS